MTGLNDGTPYNIRVKAACNTQNSGYSNLLTVSTNASNGCNTPTGLVANSIMSTSCVMNWVAVSGAINYSLDYTLVSNPTGWITATPNGTTQTLSNLQANQDYQARIKTVCGGGASSSYSGLVTFNTTTLTASAKVQTTQYEAIAQPMPLKSVAQTMRIAPNPATNEFDVMFNLKEKNKIALTLSDLFGNVLQTATLVLQEGRYTIDIRDLPTGIYFLSAILDDKEHLVQKVIKNGY